MCSAVPRYKPHSLYVCNCIVCVRAHAYLLVLNKHARVFAHMHAVCRRFVQQSRKIDLKCVPCNVCLGVAARSDNGCVAFHIDSTAKGDGSCILYGDGLRDLAGWNTIKSTNPSPASGTLCYTRSQFASIASSSTQGKAKKN